MRIVIVGGSPKALGGVEAFCARAMEGLALHGLTNVTLIPSGTAFLTIGRLPALIKGLATLVRNVRAKPDCVWLQYVNLPDLTYLLLSKALGLTVMVTPHLGSNWRSQSNPFLRALSGFLLRFADRFALISQTQESEINLPPKVPRSLIRNFLPSAIFAENVPVLSSTPQKKPLRLMHAGRLSAGKGTFLFLESCQALSKSEIAYQAKISGDTDKETFGQINRFIEKYGLSDQVQVLGRIPDDQLLIELKESDVLIHLSRIDSYPLIVLESIACGTFPICMELAGARDMVETYAGQIVSSSNAVSETVAFLGSTPVEQLRRKAFEASRSLQRDYSWEECVRLLRSALEQTISATMAENASSRKQRNQGTN